MDGAPGFAVSIPREAISRFCQRWGIVELALFGSVLRDDFRPDSDIDVLATPAASARWTLFDLMHMQEELSELLGRPVDLVSRRGIESSRNFLRRRAILDSARTVYAA